jgi:hypothetical protein
MILATLKFKVAVLHFRLRDDSGTIAQVQSWRRVIKVTPSTVVRLFMKLATLARLIFSIPTRSRLLRGSSMIRRRSA